MVKEHKDEPKEERHSAVVGGSTAGLRLLCNASIDECAKVPGDHSIYAAAGTVKHTIMETAIREGLSDREVEKRFTGAPYHDLLHDEVEKEHYGRNKVSEKDITQKVLPALAFFDDEFPMDVDISIEEKVNFEPWAVRKNEHPFDNDFYIEKAKGTADILFRNEKTGEAGLLDWKFGEGHIVNPEDNDQMYFYLAAAIHCGKLPVQETYTVWIYQPADKIDPKNHARRAEYSFKDIREFALDLRDAIEGKRKHNAGPHCKYCRGKAVCAAYKNLISAVEETDIKGLDSKQLAAEKDRIPALKRYIKEIEAHALRNALNGVVLPGYKIDEGEGQSAWKDEKAADKAMYRFGLKASERTVRSTLSPTQALIKLKEIGISDPEIEKFKKKHITRPTTGERLVPAEPGEDGNAFTRLANAMAAS